MVASSPRSMWNGNIAFGLVTVPVKLVAAVREERVNFHLLHDQDHVRLKQKMVCPHDGQEIQRPGHGAFLGNASALSRRCIEPASGTDSASCR